MMRTDGFPKTFLDHRDLWRFKALIDTLFKNPEPDRITEAVSSFLRRTPLPIDDFPVLDGTYSRTMLARHPSGWEVMAARWQKGAVSSIHGHPRYAFMMTVAGRLQVDEYESSGDGILQNGTRHLNPGEFIASIGEAPGTFDNHIHGVQAIEESLSIHISSHDATLGKTYPEPGGPAAGPS
jgi:hypothetical protein